jgi:hypothetical protein
MNVRSLSFIGLIMPAMLLLSGCGARKKRLLLKLSPEMTKHEVELKMGRPDAIHSPIYTRNGDVIDIWEYCLATVDEGKKGAKTALQCCGWLLFWPCLCFPQAWQSHYDFEIYFLKFVNNYLSQWGRRYEIDLPNKKKINLEDKIDDLESKIDDLKSTAGSLER